MAGEQNKQNTNLPKDLNDSSKTTGGANATSGTGANAPHVSSAMPASGSMPVPSGGASSAGQTSGGQSSPSLDVDAVKDTAKGLYDQAKDTAGHAVGLATDKAASAIEEHKTNLSGGLSNVADGIKRVGEHLRMSGKDQTGVVKLTAQYGDSLAQQVEKISGYFERRDVREMVRDTEQFARRNPAYFIAGAVAVGFLAARFLKSDNPNQALMRRPKPSEHPEMLNRNRTTGQTGAAKLAGTSGAGTHNTGTFNTETMPRTGAPNTGGASNVGTPNTGTPNIGTSGTGTSGTGTTNKDLGASGDFSAGGVIPKQS